MVISPTADVLYFSTKAKSVKKTTHIKIVDTKTGKVLSQHILVSNCLAAGGGLAITPDGNYLYVLNRPAKGKSSFFMADTATNEVVGEPFTADRLFGRFLGSIEPPLRG